MDKQEMLAAIGRGHLVYRPGRNGKASDYVTSVGLVKVDLKTVRMLHLDELLEERPGHPGSFRLSEKGKEVANADAARIS